MPLSNLLKSAAGTCHFCRREAGILSREHPDSRRAYQTLVGTRWSGPAP